MRKILYSLIISLSIGTICAQTATFDEASVVAARFFSDRDNMLKSCAKIFTNGQDTLLYIFNGENCYVVVGADKRVPPILAFSDNHLYSDEEVIPPVRMWLNNYIRQTEEIKKDFSQIQPVNAGWKKVLSENADFVVEDSVLPLVKSKWGQGAFYNYYCPRDYEGYNNRTVTGCVATAIAQLIYYFRFPDTGTGSYSYVNEDYGPQFADYGATTYNFDAMCDAPSSLNLEIAKLMYHCGVGVDMHYGPDGSGMRNHSAARLLRTYFKYSPQTEYLFRDSTDLNWDSVIVNHLSRNIPMYYAGWANPLINDGHGFICDGFKKMNDAYLYHFNFGWDGDRDGYFYTDRLNLAGTHFNLAQELIVNAYPDTTQYTYPISQPLTGSKIMTSLAGSFLSGTGAAYSPNMDYTWEIQPATDTVISITLDVDYQIAEGDTLWISSPDTSEIYAISADTGRAHISWNVPTMTVVFKSNGEVESAGFRANYSVALPDYCQFSSPLQTLNSNTGTITDGSGDHDYNALSNCVFKVVLPTFSAITLYVRSLDLEEGHDFLRIYYNTVSEDKLLATLTGTVQDTMMVFNQKRLFLLFESDEQNNADGFTIDYEGGYVGVEDFIQGDVFFGPNPATDFLNIQSEYPIRHLQLLDLQGRLISTYDGEGVRHTINVSQFASGIYFLRMEINGQICVRKFVKR